MRKCLIPLTAVIHTGYSSFTSSTDNSVLKAYTKSYAMQRTYFD